MALHMFGRQYGNEAALNLSRELLQVIISEKNPLVYHQYDLDSYNEYISFGGIDAAQVYTKYRYVKKNGKDTLAQTSGSASYLFDTVANTVIRSDGQSVKLRLGIGFRTDPYLDDSQSQCYPYIDEVDATKYFGIRTEYISQTDWGVIVTSAMEKDIQKIIAALKEAAGIS